MDSKLNFAEISSLIVLVNQEISELKMCMAKAEFNSCDERIIESAINQHTTILKKLLKMKKEC